MRTVTDEERLAKIHQICEELETLLDKKSLDINLDVGEHIYITHYLLMYSMTISDKLGVSAVDVAAMLEHYNSNYHRNYFVPIVKPGKQKPLSHLEVVKSDEES